MTLTYDRACKLFTKMHFKYTGSLLHFLTTLNCNKYEISVVQTAEFIHYSDFVISKILLEKERSRIGHWHG